MTVGAVAAAVAVAAAIIGLRSDSGVERRLALIAPGGPAQRPRWRVIEPEQLRDAGLALSPEQLFGTKVALALTLAVLASLLGAVVPIGPVALALAAYAGFVAPSIVVDRRAASRRTAAGRAIVVLIERLDALVSAGRPAETALAILLSRATGAELVDDALRRSHAAYSLGAPLFRTVAASARGAGLEPLASIADDLERARDLASGSLAVIRDRRSALRAAERSRLLSAAAQVEGKLMLVLVLCYLPALVLLVVIPLFIGLLRGLFA